jgi:hypothetical protein
MNILKQPLSVIGLVVVLLLGACSQSEIKTAPAPEKGSTPEAYPYPYPQSALPSGGGPTSYPFPIPDQPTPDVVYVEPTPGSDTGVIIGRLVDLMTEAPLPFLSVYAGTIIPFAKGEGFSVGVQEKSSPHTMSDIEGRFALGNVPPGTYVLLVWTPFSSYMITQPGSKDLMEITVEAGKTLDIGVVKALDPMKTE